MNKSDRGVPAAVELENALMGISSTEALISRLRPEASVTPQTVEHLTRWLREASDEDRAWFCKGTTGSPALSSDRVITLVAGGDENRVPSAHTCSLELGLPNYPTYEVLKTNLSRFIDEVKGDVGFGFV